MAKNIYYKYNPVTDNFERFYPSLKTRLINLGKLLSMGTVIGLTLFFLIFYTFGSRNEKELRAENAELRTQYNILERRLNSSLEVMANIQNRDDNFYRVIMQMDPVNRSRRLAGLDNEERYKSINKLSDAALVSTLTRKLDLLDRQLYAQSLSFDELKKYVGEHNKRLEHIPSIMPVRSGFTIASGYGSRRDPISGNIIFHSGLDLGASEGTPVYATANGIVTESGRKEEYGNCVYIDHGYNYSTRFGHMSKILVKPGQIVKRGDKIGLVGSTGRSTGPHLHYEVRFKDTPQNPVNYTFMDLTPEQYSELIIASDNAAELKEVSR